MSDQDNTDAWSSDGNSVSTDSISSESDAFSSEETKGARYLKQAGIFTREEVLDQAIDRWNTYSRLCERGIASLRDTMIDSYVKEAVEAKSRLNSTLPIDSTSASAAGKSSTTNDTSALSKTLPRHSQRLAEIRALRRIGRPSKRAENAKHLAATTQFAIFSSHLAPWRPMSASSQKCQYRDPTISTWEYKCAKPPIPLLPYCAEHLVLFEETQPQAPSITTPTIVASSPSREPDADAEGSNSLATSPVAASTIQKPLESPAPAKPASASSRPESEKSQKPFSKKATSKARSTTDGSAGQSEIQFPPQYLFRKCGGGPNNDCSQPVIAFTDSTRCCLHTNVTTLFSSAIKKEESVDIKPEQDHEPLTDSYFTHPLLLQYLKKKEMKSEYADSDILIVSACRTPIGRFCGSLASIPAHVFGGAVISECIKRASKQFFEQTEQGILGQINEVIMGQVYTAGGGQNPARQAAKAAGLSYTVPAWGLNMLCASGMKAVCQCAQSLRLEGGMAIAGGQESMSRCPHITAPGCSLRRGGGGGNAGELPVFGDFRLVDSLLHDGLEDAFHGVHMGVTAENIAQKFRIGRKDQDAFAFESQVRCRQAIELGKFKSEIVPITILKFDKRGAPCEPMVISHDEPPRPQTTMEALAKLRPVFTNGMSQPQNATVTAGNASALADGAAALLLCRADTAKSLGLRCPLGRIVAWHQSGCEPQVMGLGPIDSVKGLMDKLSWSVDDVDLFELNEAFAAQSLAVLNELGLPKDRTNVNGGAIALGHPIGCSGARILVTLIHSLHRLAHNSEISKDNETNGTPNGACLRAAPLRGIAALCVGGGMGLAIAVEVLPNLTTSDCPLLES